MLKRLSGLLVGAMLTVLSVWPAQAAEPIRLGQTFIAASLDPGKGSSGFALTSHGVGENLFTVDKTGALVAGLASGAERQSDNVWLVRLKPDRKFSDGSPVDAPSLAAGFNNTVEINPISRATGGRLVFEAVDARTLKVTSERPVPVMQALLAEWVMVAYRLKADGSPVFTGPYEVASFRPDSGLSLVANKFYPGAERRSPVELRKFSDAQAMALAFEAGQLDIAFGLPSEAAPRLKATPGLTVKSFAVGYQYMALMNTARPAMTDVRVRRAVDLAIDRAQLIAAINGGQAATGMYPAYFPFSLREARKTDLAASRALLEEAGWKAGADGIRARDGAPLKLLALGYPQRPDLVTMLPVVKAQLKLAGIDLATGVVENSSQAANAGDFDIFLWAQHTAPSGDPAFALGTLFRSDGGQNFTRYKEPAFDAILDRLARESDSEKRGAIAADAQAKLFADAPASFLVTPAWFVGVSQRMAKYEPWGSDYYVLRADIGE